MKKSTLHSDYNYNSDLIPSAPKGNWALNYWKTIGSNLGLLPSAPTPRRVSWRSPKVKGDLAFGSWKAVSSNSDSHSNFLFLFLFLLLSSCTSKEINVKEVIEEKVASRIEGFKENFRQSCEDKVLEVALRRADSLLLLRARRMRVIAGRPPKPRRPGAPPPMSLSEELPLRPLFPFEIRFDTILRDSLYQDSLRLDSLMILQLDSLRIDSIDRGLLPPDTPIRDE